MKTLLPIMMVPLLSVSGLTLAKADVEIIWQEPEQYTDIRAANESRIKFRERTLNQLETYINTLSEALPDGYKLLMTVEDVDLAGQVWPGSFVGLGLHSAADVRLIKRIDIPRISFSYKLLDNQGQTLKEQQEVKLKDMSFQDRHNPFFDSESLRYEKNMLREWFNETFGDDKTTE